MNLLAILELPEFLPALILVPAAWFYLKAAERLRSRKLSEVLGERSQKLLASFDPRRQTTRRVLMTSGLFFALLALLQPSWGTDQGRTKQRNANIVICLDVSRSMLARDIPGGRLGHAKQAIEALTRHARGDKLGLVAFAGDAFLRTPLTRDMASFTHLLRETDTLSVARGGTDLGKALETALRALKASTSSKDSDRNRHNNIILITDGEDHLGRGLQVAIRCKAQNTTIHCMGVGSLLGSKISVSDSEGEKFLRAKTGQDVVSILDASGLQSIANATGGVYRESSDSPRSLREIYANVIATHPDNTSASSPKRKNRFALPLLLAFALFFLELCLGNRRRS